MFGVELICTDEACTLRGRGHRAGPRARLDAAGLRGLRVHPADHRGVGDGGGARTPAGRRPGAGRVAHPVVGVEPGPDDRMRCWWCLGAPEYVDYHDRVWGRPMHDDRDLFEHAGARVIPVRPVLVDHPAQAGGLPPRLRRLGHREGSRLWRAGTSSASSATPGSSATAARSRRRSPTRPRHWALQERGETLDALLWSFAPDREAARPPASRHDLDSQTPESTAMAKELKERGFRFVGPHHRLLADAGRGAGERPPGGLRVSLAGYWEWRCLAISRSNSLASRSWSARITCITALISARWVNACGKLPRWRPERGSISSA